MTTAPLPDMFSREAMYETFRRRDLAFFAEDVLGMEVSGHHTEWSGHVAKNMRLALNAPRDHGKCLAATSLVLMANGTWKPIAKIEAGESVLSDGKPWRVNHVWSSGHKPVFDLRVAGGRRIRATGEHRFWRDGWVKLSDLAPGDWVSVPRRISPVTVSAISDAEVKLLAYAIAEGNMTGSNFHITNQHPEIISEIASAAGEMGWQSKYCPKYFNSRLTNNYAKIGSPQEWCRKHEIWGKLAYHKRVPDAVFAATTRQVAIFLNRFFACDGWVSKGQIGLTLANEGLIDDIQRLLLRVGVCARKSRKRTSSGKPTFSLMIQNVSEARRFLEEVGYVFTKERQSAALYERCLSVKPIERDMRVADADYMLVKVESITAAGTESVFDIEVEGKHEFVADGFKVHNSYFFSFAYVIWRIYYGWIPPLPSADFKSIPRRSLGYIFSSSQENAVKFLEMVKLEIETNPKLQHLVPKSDATWSKMEIVCANGATVRAKGWGMAVRGGHPGWVVCDDVLSDENLYSEIQREKQIEYFYSAVTPMVIPGGQIVVIGCVHPDTYVLTKDGPTRIGDLAGDQDLGKRQLLDFNQPVYGENGWQKATKYWINGKCKTKRLTTTYGMSLEASHRHPVRVRKGAGPSCREDAVWRRMDEVQPDDKLLVEIGQNIYGDGFDDEAMAYFMGLWTAEGSSEPCGRLTICTSEPTLLSYLDSEPLGLKFSRHQNKSRVQDKAFYDHLSDLGVKFTRAEAKEVPAAIMRGTKRAQAAFLRGFADGDGCSYVSDRIQQINLSSASSNLIMQIRAMLLNMGLLPSYVVKPPGISELVHGRFDSHQLVLSAGYAFRFMRDIGFTVAHKIKEMRPLKARTRLFVGIKNIEDGETETVDFVIPDDHTFCSNGFISHNTPFHQEDLYSSLAKNASYFFRRYSAILASGQALWPTRYTRLMLDEKKREVGSTRFTREYLCVPIADTNSLFPERVLAENYQHDMELVTEMTQSLRSEYTIYGGVDLALSSTIGADYTVITTIGIDKYGNRRLFDLRRFKGRSMTDQLREIQDCYRTFRHTKILIEDNAFQRVFRDELVSKTDLPIEGFTTTATAKNSLERGVPSLQILFENKKFQIPRKTERDRRITDELLHELKCFTYVNGRLQGLGAHDDCVMSLWIANEASQAAAFTFTFS